jgi:hypothetical protein
MLGKDPTDSVRLPLQAGGHPDEQLEDLVILYETVCDYRSTHPEEHIHLVYRCEGDTRCGHTKRDSEVSWHLPEQRWIHKLGAIHFVSIQQGSC